MDRPIGKLERLCYERHERDLALSLRPEGHPKGFRFDPEEGERIVIFLERYCRHSKGEWAGQPIILAEWQKRALRIAFGWLRPDGSRRFRELWFEIARKNGKTLLAAGIGLYLLVADDEPGAEVYVTATTKKQALICHKAARQMVQASPALAKRIKVPKAESANLVYKKLGGKMEILSSDWGSQDGLNPSGDIRDEVHEWKAEELAAKLDTAVGARRQPLTVKITTAGVYDPEAIGWKDHDYATQILEGTLEDDEVFAFIAAIDEGDDWADTVCRAASPDHSHPSCVLRKANPNLGVSPKIEFLNGEIEQALRRADKVNDVLRYYENRWTQQVERWLDVDRWLETERRGPPLTEQELEGLPCVGGLDLADKIDMCAFVLIFQREGGRLDLVCRFWLPRERAMEQAKLGRKHLLDWMNQGWITGTDGDVVDHQFIRREINELRDRFAIGEIGYDPAKATQMATWLRDEDGFSAVEVIQGTRSLTEPSQWLEAAVIERKVRATGKPGGPNPVMRWMVGNVAKHTDAGGRIRPDRIKSKGKIDGISALVTGMSRLVQTTEAKGSYLDGAEVLLV